MDASKSQSRSEVNEDAGGDTPPAQTKAPEIETAIREVLQSVYDPELGINIVDLGLVYDVNLRGDGFVTITMTLTTPGCPMHASIGDGVGMALQHVEGVTGGQIHIVWEPRWNPSMMTEAARAALGYW